MHIGLRRVIFLSFFVIASPWCFGAEQPRAFAVIGDTQRTLGVERVVLGREQNDPERDLLIQSIANDKPEFAVHLGDMVDWGASTKVWKAFDRLIEPLRLAKIELFPVFGNHEYFGWNKTKELENVYTRFPQLKASHWYLKRVGNLALVFLDSNQKALGEDWDVQTSWLQGTLDQLDADTGVRGVLVFAHHPVYSNSKVSADEPCVNQSILPLFSRAKKTVAYISGHAHGYEHFFENGKHFIVSAGGGGPRVTYYTGKKQHHPDLFLGAGPRPFNYLLIQPENGKILVTVKGLDKDETQVRVIDTISIPLK